MASPVQSKKLRVILFPFFATSHIIPFTEFAFHLATARPGDVEAIVAVTPANAPIVQSVLDRRGPWPGDHAAVEVATYAFPRVEGLPPGVENHSTVEAADDWRILAAGCNQRLMRPEHESLIRSRSADVIISDVAFMWNADIAANLGVPFLTFHVVGTFPVLAHLFKLARTSVPEAPGGVVTVPGFPEPDIRLPVTELPEVLRTQQATLHEGSKIYSTLKNGFGLVVNTFLDLEDKYCGMYVSEGHVKRAYFVGPLSLPLPAAAAVDDQAGCIDWLDKKPPRSVVYLCFGSLTHMSEAQLRELALGLEASGKSFLWVVRSKTWSGPPEGWKERVADRGKLVMGWVPQTLILEHPSVGAFVTHCGWNSVLEAVVAGVPVLTWPMVYEQFITERLLTHVHAIGERMWPEGAGVRSTRAEEHELVPAAAVAQSVARFLEPGGAGDAARSRVKELSAKAHAAMAEGGSSHQDLHRLIDDLIEEKQRTAGAGTIAV